MHALAIARLGMSMRTGQAFAERLSTVARARARAVSCLAPGHHRHVVANHGQHQYAAAAAHIRLLSTSCVHGKEQRRVEAPPIVGEEPSKGEFDMRPHRASPPLSDRESKALAPEFDDGVSAPPLDGIRVLDLTRVLGRIVIYSSSPTAEIPWELEISDAGLEWNLTLPLAHNR
ncbi:hypothetical protein DFQ26_006842 [Actinomortierella ambigua]|nr:hypothetical protein DFQ26_006842 [Actinomortierella ambigua]